jgi:hypothetical protein
MFSPRAYFALRHAPLRVARAPRRLFARIGVAADGSDAPWRIMAAWRHQRHRAALAGVRSINGGKRGMRRHQHRSACASVSGDVWRRIKHNPRAWLRQRHQWRVGESCR